MGSADKVQLPVFQEMERKDMSGDFGTMCGISQAVEYLADVPPRKKDDDMPQRIIARLRYVRAKDEGIKPKYHKGLYGNKYDHWTCGNCGAETRDGVGDTYCRNCGYRILWDSCRCLTGRGEEDESDDKRGE